MSRVPAVDALHHMVALLGDADRVSPGAPFYDRIADAACQLAGMERALVFLYDDDARRVRAVGSHDVDPAVFGDRQVTIRTAAIAERALREDRVIEAGEDVGQDIPQDLAEHFDVRRLACVPMSAGGRMFGVLLVEPSEPGPLSEANREALWMLGKITALAAATRMATREHERSRVLAERIDLAREVHDHAIQRLFGVALALAGEGELPDEDRARCAEEVERALAELRDAVQRPLAREGRPDNPGFEDELGRLVQSSRPARVEVTRDGAVPPELDGLASSVLREAVRNARKHAQATHLRIDIARDGATFRLDVVNDGVLDGTPAHRGTGLGLRLAAFEALSVGGLVEFGPRGTGEWRVRLTAPLSHGEAA